MTSDEWFVEILQPKELSTFPERIDCYILVNIDPKCCGALARDLNFILPLRGGTEQSFENKCNEDPLVEQPQQMPSVEHLKRIRRRPATANELEALANQTAIEALESCQNESGSNPLDEKYTESPSKEAPKKRAKRGSKSRTNSEREARTWSLDMLVGSVAAVDALQSQQVTYTETIALDSILTKYNISATDLVRVPLPGRSAETKEELHQWNTDLWPTIFFEKQTDEFKKEELQLSNEERTMMIDGMNAAIEDAFAARSQLKLYCSVSESTEEEKSFLDGVAGVVVMQPESGSIVSRASAERQMQTGNANMGAQSNSADRNNPMCTSAILAIQGVSRKERYNAIGHGMESKEFQKGQYLCTGYDVYLTKEPNAYEAMALVHSRVRRVIFGSVDAKMGGLGGVTSNTASGIKGGIHCLPGTNHHYRAFRMNLDICGTNPADSQAPMKKIVSKLNDLHPI